VYRSDNALPYGFRIVGDCRNDRRLIDWPSAFLTYCDCDERAQVETEAYLSAFRFGVEFTEFLNRTGSPKGYAGECWSDWLWFDIDRDNIELARIDAGKLAGTLVERFQLAGNEQLVFFSGSKSFHIGLPLSVCGSPRPSNEFHSVCRRLAEQIVSAIECQANGTAPNGLNRATLEFIRDGATTGDRHRRLFSAAANLAEFGCSFELAFALLSDAALDSGLPPSDVRRQIECGLRHTESQTF
jgi:hypothetical protein